MGGVGAHAVAAAPLHALRMNYRIDPVNGIARRRPPQGPGIRLGAAQERQRSHTTATR